MKDPLSPRVARAFDVRKDDGSWWKLEYTSAGARWSRSTAPTSTKTTNPEPSGHPPHTASSRRTPTVAPAQVQMALEGVQFMADAWDRHQRRVMEQAAIDEAKHTEWLMEMLGRWSEVHAAGDVVDLRSTEYLAREARAMMDLLVSNKKVALPQSILYELSTVQGVVRGYRHLLLEQFEALSASPEIGLRDAVHAAMPQHALDMAYVRSLGEDPEVEWVRRLREKSTSEFNKDLAQTWRDPQAFQNKLFRSTELAVFDGTAVTKDEGFIAKILEKVNPALPRIPIPSYKNDAADRLDLYRELSLLPAEVERARALTAAWLSVAEVLNLSGNQLTVSMGGGTMAIGHEPLRKPLELTGGQG